ncbi:MAG: hypothetical protein IH899_07685 [Planctomycetes bacterium]|nr:hypothetical protein [Planctomycetota bacterium]
MKAQFKFFHQLEQMEIFVRRIILPDFFQLLEIEFAVVFLDFPGVHHLVDGVGGPVRFQKNDLVENRAVFEMQEYSQIVEVIAQVVGLYFILAKVFTNGPVFRKRDEVLF